MKRVRADFANALKEHSFDSLKEYLPCNEGLSTSLKGDLVNEVKVKTNW